jgi:hypothetical protein
MIDELERIWKEAVMPCQGTIVAFTWRAEENHEKPQTG